MASLGLYLAYRMTDRAYHWHQRDALVYFDASRHLPGSESVLYGHPYGVSKLPFTYPPFTALVFRLLGTAGWDTFRLLLPVLTFLALITALRSSLRASAIARAWPRHRRVALCLAIAAACLWLTPIFIAFQAGQINLFLLALILWDFSLHTESRWKGLGVGLAAGLKITPAIFIIYLLLTGRYRAALTALGTAGGTVLIGALVLPQASLHYWSSIGGLSGEATGHGRINLAATHNQSLNGLVLRTLGDTPTAHAIWLAAACLTAVAGLACAAAVQRHGHELWGAVLCGTTAVLISPLSWAHHWVWIVPALALMVTSALQMAQGKRALTLLGGLALLLWAWYAAWPVALPEHPPKLSPAGIIALPPASDAGLLEHLWEFVHQNAFVVTGLFALSAAAAWSVINRLHGDRAVTQVESAMSGSSISP
ncbi:glycosyltransferase 87 family protein [Streptomyces sp. NRRL B-1347]|uniref:glycosyltransferase 87 family protein n=1 Tax=Streptomyces sp. NRRL B-1347 TaxID=1476877 RepID=UPI00131B3650|nr:glycosyltransferase 87 family protein [Streptomyces sp. NRRL B-1347]